MIECTFRGTIFRDAELRTSKAGKPYARFTVRAGHGDRVQWVSVMLFGDEATAQTPDLVKGRRVEVEGKLSLDQWVGKDGEKRHGISVLSNSCKLYN